MFVVWSGRGYVGFAALIPVFASCAGLPTVEPIWVFFSAFALSLFFAGVVCVYFGTRWNLHGWVHTLNGLPLQVWGWVYLSILVLAALTAIGGGIKHGLDKPMGLYP